MGMGKTMQGEIVAWGVLAMSIVLVLIILGKFKDVSGVTSSINNTIDLFITGLSEPANWVIIVIVALIGFGIIKFFQKSSK